MQPEPGTPEEWLAHALSDLDMATTRVSPRQLLEHLCFHAQHAAVKGHQ